MKRCLAWCLAAALLLSGVRADAAWHSVLQVSSAPSVPYAGPLDAQAGAAYCGALFACSKAIADAGTAHAVRITNGTDTCYVTVSATGQLATTVSGCTGGSNGTAVTTFCGTCTAASSDAFPDQSASGLTFGDNLGVAFTANAYLTFQGWTFNGTNQNLAGSNAASDYLGSGAFTIYARVKPTELNNGAGYSPWGGQISAMTEFGIGGQAGNATGKPFLNTSLTTNNGNGSCTISVNAWHTISVSYDRGGTKAWQFVADGVDCGSGTGTDNGFDGGGVAEIGTGRIGTDLFKGPLRGIVVYKAAHSLATQQAVGANMQ